jgi:hypothetical protein
MFYFYSFRTDTTYNNYNNNNDIKTRLRPSESENNRRNVRSEMTVLHYNKI